MITAESLTKTFGTFTAVDHISFEVKKGEIFGLLGPNGAGKSTTIKMLTGILAPTSGKAIINGYNIFTDTEKIKASIGYMSQKFSLYNDLTVEENINFYNGIYSVPKEKQEERKKWVLDIAHLTDLKQMITGSLPAGWKQRLALGCAILHEPAILFLDEPTSGVDPINRRMFWDLIYQLAASGVTFIVSTHYMDEAEYFDRLALIYRGKLIGSGTPDQMKEESHTASLEDMFVKLIESYDQKEKQL
jgi:ABC-2 type transport system ATP-binding protein